MSLASPFPQGEKDLLAELSHLTILTASRCLHGDDVREELFEEVSRLFHDLDEGMTPLSVFMPYAPVPAHFRRDKVPCFKASEIIRENNTVR